MTQPPQKKGKIQFQLGWGGLFAVFATSVCVLLWVFILGFWAGQKMVHRGSPPPSPETQTSLPAEQSAPPVPPPTHETLPPAPPVAPTSPPVTPASPPEAPAPEPPPAQNAEVSGETAKETLPPPAPASPVARPAPETPQEIPPPPAETKRPSVSPPPPAQPTTQSAAHPAKTRDTAGGAYFTLQIASFKDRAQAEHAALNWADKGYRAHATSVDLGAKGTWYRVYIGRFETLDEAKAFERIISKKEGIKTYIVSVKD